MLTHFLPTLYSRIQLWTRVNLFVEVHFQNYTLCVEYHSNNFLLFCYEDFIKPVIIASLSIAICRLIVESPSAIRSISTSKTNRRFISNQLV